MAAPLALFSLASTVIGAGVSAYGAYAGGQAQQSMFNYQARVAQINAGIAQEQARAETIAGDIRAQQSGIKTAERVGMTRAAMAAGGLDLGTGSPKSVISSEEEIGQFDQASIRNDAARRDYGYNVAAFGDQAQSSLDIAAGEGAVQAADVNVGTSLLGGATQVSDKWVKFGQEGISPFSTA